MASALTDRPTTTARQFVALLPYLSLALATALLWMAVNHKMSWTSWQVPMSYTGDALYNLACIEAAKEGDFVPVGLSVIERLGAPFGANWNDFPMYEKPMIWALGSLAWWIGLFPASNAAVMIAHVLAGWSFYFCCRVLRWRKGFAWPGALLFAFAYYHSMRGFGHVFIAYSYTVPLAILSCWLVFGSRRLNRPGTQRRLCVGTALLMGISNPYNLGIYLQLLVLAMLANWAAGRNRENLRVGVASLLTAVIGFTAVNSGTFYLRWMAGKNDLALQRNYTQTERFGLKPIELVVPPADHRVPGLARIGSYYREHSLVRGEMFSPYLGWVALLALAWMFAEGMRRLLRRDPRTPAGAPLQALWIGAYSVLGGLNSLLGLAGFALLRASNRNSIFLSALALMFLVSRASGLARLKPAWRIGLLAPLVLGIGLFDQIPKRNAAVAEAGIQPTLEKDRAFFATLEKALPARGMVFQLPVVEFPEAAGVHKFEGYHHLRPFFHTVKLQFSYGSNKGRPREAWQKFVEGLPAQGLLECLESCGFSAILINRSGYTDNARGLLRQLRALGRTNILENGSKDIASIQLRPAAQPQLPGALPPLRLEFGYGWTGVEHTDRGWRRRSDGNSLLCAINGTTKPLYAQIRFNAAGTSKSRMAVSVPAGVLCSKDLASDKTEEVVLTGKLAPGPTYFDVRNFPRENPTGMTAFYLEDAFVFGLEDPVHDNFSRPQSSSGSPPNAGPATSEFWDSTAAPPTGK